MSFNVKKITNSEVVFDGTSIVRIRHSVIRMMVAVAAIGMGTISPILGQELPPTDPSIVSSAPKSDATPKAFKRSTEFLRLSQTAAGDPKAMQTAITRYRPAEGDLVIDLIAAVHIGEGEYYQQLNTQFEQYDVVLYELVAPEGTRIPRGGRDQSGGQSPVGLISWMQKKAQTTLGLESQLDRIDYQKSNFTHADMSPTEIGKKMEERGETPLTIGLNAFSEMMRQQHRLARKMASESKDSDSGLANSMTTDSLFEIMGNPLKLKRMIAGQFTQSGALDAGLGATLNQMLVTDRNAAAIKVMQKEIALGKKKIAIFYGAAHMPDFEKRLVNEFGMKKTKQVWVDAWDLTQAPEPTPTNKTTDLLFKMLEALGK